MKPYFFDVLIMAAQSSGTPHATALQAANPGLEIRVHYYPEPEDQEARLAAWRNGDRNIRQWWAANRDAVASRYLLVLEWDCYVSGDLTELIPPPEPGTGLLAARVFSPVADARSFRPFCEVGRLPKTMAGRGLQPLGCVLFSRAALDAICDPRYDEVFAADIFSELRLPSVVSDAGFSLGSMPLPHCGVTPVTPPAGASGIWHPVKNPVTP